MDKIFLLLSLAAAIVAVVASHPYGYYHEMFLRSANDLFDKDLAEKTEGHFLAVMWTALVLASLLAGLGTGTLLVGLLTGCALYFLPMRMDERAGRRSFLSTYRISAE